MSNQQGSIQHTAIYKNEKCVSVKSILVVDGAITVTSSLANHILVEASLVPPIP